MKKIQYSELTTWCLFNKFITPSDDEINIQLSYPHLSPSTFHLHWCRSSTPANPFVSLIISSSSCDCIHQTHLPYRYRCIGCWHWGEKFFCHRTITILRLHLKPSLPLWSLWVVAHPPGPPSQIRILQTFRTLVGPQGLPSSFWSSFTHYYQYHWKTSKSSEFEIYLR